jgi:exodeoxyribonuclease III
MKIFTWNVNGIRSIFRTTFRDWLAVNNPDIVCLQEIKADYRELSKEYTQINGYHAYFNSALKKGYSGVAIYTKTKPLAVETKLGMDRFDQEGRSLKLTFDDFILFNFYIPHGGRAKENLAYKLEVYKNIFKTLKVPANKKLILVGDFNIAHTEQDLYSPEKNEDSIMFTPEERKQIDALIGLGYVDTFRHKYPNKKAYTWWSYMRNSRERDAGWRIDYIFVDKRLKKNIKDVFIQKEILGSDHGPYGITLK